MSEPTGAEKDRERRRLRIFEREGRVMSRNSDETAYDRFTDAPPIDHQESYDETLERYKEGWSRKLEDDLANGR